MSGPSLFGWDLLYNSAKDEIKTKSDVITCFAHYVLILKGFKCIGIGDDKILDKTETENITEKLPAGWSKGYTLRYVYEGRLYHFLFTTVEDTIQLNLIRIDERKVSLISLELNLVQKTTGNITEMLPSYAQVKERIEKELVDAVIVSDKVRNSETQTSTMQQQPALNARCLMDPEDIPTVGVGFMGIPDPRRPGMDNPDLQPFGPLRVDPTGMGGMGSGMIFPGPGMPGNLGPLGGPRGGPFGPPGARFDPIGPMNPDGNQRPSRNRRGDDFPPPDFGYDMFM